MIGTLPSCQAPSKKVQVWEKLTAAVVWAMITIHAAGQRRAHHGAEFPKDFLAEFFAIAIDSRLIDHNRTLHFLDRSRYAPRPTGQASARHDDGGLAERPVAA
jgi:hypothetical protein